MQAYDEDARTLYEIPADNFAKFEQQVAKLSKRSVKLGCSPIIPFVFDRFKRLVNESKPDGPSYLVYKVMFTVDTPKLGDYTFVARIDHSNDTGNIIRPVPNTGIAIADKYRTVKPFCDHCNVLRARRDTYLVCDDTSGEIKQVGSTCLADFLGHDALRLARMAEFLGYADECARAMGGFTGALHDLRWIDVDHYLTHCATMIRLHGWVSRKTAMEYDKDSTASLALGNSYPSPKDAPYAEKPTPEDRQMAADALAWAQTLRDKAELSEYEHNVSVVAHALMIETRSMGLCASIVGVYQMMKAREAGEEIRRRTQKNSTYQGKVGDKLSFGPAVLTHHFTIDGNYGTSYVYFFLTDTGNVLKWKASRCMELSNGHRYTVSGTVKDHAEYKEIQQTVLTRCKVAAEVVEQKEAA
ncbi:MAG: hypothetical protein EOP83_01630 [Verrucomicrobiaceae bacterium]|nr:MAG: hypothetical protein EOP83_01630 [Verrucomicrobiaceae bacterium]